MRDLCLWRVACSAFQTEMTGTFGDEAPTMDMSAEIVTDHGGHRVLVSLDGRQVTTPPVEHLAFYAGLGALVATGLLEPQVAVAIGVGHALLDLTHRPGLRAVGEAFEEA
jgi:hypothetical protein